jgi:multidrug efflux pump subunit AcrA (membrane-fusion protein)
LVEFVQSLASRQAVLVRVDLPGGETLAAPPSGARVVALSGKATDAKFFSPTIDVDPQIQGQGFIFLVQPNAVPLAPGQAVTVWLQVPGDPLTGVIVPRDSVLRLEGAGWVYVMNKDKGGEGFTRKKIPLDRPTDAGWFVTGSLKPDDYIVVTGAQTLLSEELKAALSPD